MLTKRPPCIFARLGGQTGERLSRAAFAVLLKFSLSIDSFLKLSATLVAAESQVEREGDLRIRYLAQLPRIKEDEDFKSLLKLWEEAAKMRKWT